MMINHKLLKLRATYQIAFEELLEDKDAEIPIDRSRLLDMKKMLLGYVNMSEKLLIGLEAALKKLLRCRMIINISDESDSEDCGIVEDTSSFNQKRIDNYSSMLQKEQFLKIPEVFETTSESSEAENSKPSNTPSSSQSYVLKSTQLRPASSYAKPSNTERRKIVTVPYKPTVKLPCELLKPIRKLNFISNKTVSKTASYNPRDDAIALKNIKEKIYQKNYLKINEDVCKEIQKQIVPSSESSDSEIGVSLPIKKPKARRNTTAKSPKKETKIKITPKKPSKIKVPKKKVIKEKKNKAKLRIPSPVVENNSDSTEEFKEDDELSMEEYGKDNLFYSPPKTYPKDWMYSNEIDPLRNSLEAPQIKSSTSTEFNSLDPEGLMEHMDNVVVKTIKRGRGRPRLTKKKGEFNPRSVKIKKEN